MPLELGAHAEIKRAPRNRCPCVGDGIASGPERWSHERVEVRLAHVREIDRDQEHGEAAETDLGQSAPLRLGAVWLFFD